MLTKPPALPELLLNILADIRGSESKREAPRRLHVIYEESIEEEVKLSLRADTKNDRKYKQLITRIPDINLSRKITDKLARVYNKPATRKVKTGTDADQELVDFYSSALSLDTRMNTANHIFELTRGAALEPYLGSDGKPRLRVLTNYQVRAYAANPDEPNEITAITKLMGKVTLPPEGAFLERVVGRYHTYTATDFVEWTDESVVKTMPNPAGRIPFVWLSNSEFILNTYAPESDINSAVLVPKYYADLFYAMCYTAHSVIASIDLDLPPNLTYDPGSIIDLKTDDTSADGGKQGRIETVTPNIKVADALELIKQAVFDILESRGIKPPQTTTSLERPNASAALIENADASSYILQRCAYFMRVEQELWDLIKHLHNSVWLDVPGNQIANKKKFSPSFVVDVVFGEVKPIEIRKETLENIKLQRDQGLMSRKQAAAELYPHFTDAQLDAWLKEAASDAVLSQGPQPPLGNTEGAGGPGNNKDDSDENPRGP